jgi:hypothetical protein
MRRLLFSSILGLFAIAAGLGWGWPASAEEQPPARVGRVSFVSGQLGFHAKGETQWSPAAVNYPVATGGAFWTDPRSRAEIRIGAQTIALASDTQIDVTRLDQQVLQIAVPQGRIELHLRQLGDGNSAEVDIPRGGVWLLQPGIYDIAAGSPDHPARIMVFEGSARFVGGTLDQGIKAGEVAVINGTDTLTATIERAAPDAFVQWCRSRDYREQRLAAPYHISPEMTGYEELDAYGSWRAVPDYGEVWYPRSVGAGWAPYRDGHWTWVDPWGWTWVDAAPWGFAPSHYGRWAYLDGGWGWVPGDYSAAPAYAAALVAFLTDPGAIVARAARDPVVGWFPLGPGETASGTGAFADRRGTTVVPQQIFANGGRVAGAVLPVSGAALQNARVAAQSPVARAGAARAGSAAATGTLAGAGIAAGGAATAAAISGQSAARGGSRIAGPGRGSTAGLAPIASGGLSGSSAPAGAHFRARQFAAPSVRSAQFAGVRGARGGPPHAATRFAAPRAAPVAAVRGGGGAPHGGGGGAHAGGAKGPHGGGGGGAPHGGGGGGGGGGAHAGGGKGPHGAKVPG